MKSIDCQGLACPAPVLTVKDAIEEEGLNELTVIVDNEAGKENVTRFLESQNFEASTKEDGGNFHIIARKKEETGCQVLSFDKPEAAKQKIMVVITTEHIGHGDDELGSKLMASFLKTLNEMGDELWRLVFLNNGVKLTIDGSPVLSDLKDLEAHGIYILVCGTCLTHFDLLDKKQVGETTNMLDIVTAMQLADKVINV
jgi:selenium metabolism protein YedF